MNHKQIDKFFQALSQNIEGAAKGKIRVILTGAAAGILMGGNRPSIDIDFGIECDKKYLPGIEAGIKKASGIAGIAVNFSEDIDGWSEITFLDYKRHTRPYKTFGPIEVSILSPAYWSIGKFTRYLDPDVDDLVKVLRSNLVAPAELAKVLGRALAKSPRSTASFTFRRHVEHFFKTYGPSIWAGHYDQDKCLEAFYRACDIKVKPQA